MNSNIFHHVKLKIALTIPASHDEIIETNNSAAQGLNTDCYINQLLADYDIVIFNLFY